MKDFMRLLFVRMYLFFGVFYRKAWMFLLGGNLRGVAMQSGELIVIGHDKVEIELGHRPPQGVIVKFENEYMVTPCNPRHHDELRYEIHNRHHPHPHDHRHDHCRHEDNYVLTIHWHVTGVRVIKWVVYY